MTVIAPTAPAVAGVTPRLRLRPPGASPGPVDGVWLPRSRDLAAELVPLLAELRRAGHTVRRVTYDLTAWQPAGRRLAAEGVLVRLSGFHLPRPETVRLLSTSGATALVLAVVDPDVPVEETAAVLDLTVQPLPHHPDPQPCISGA
jgi:hypothetical protein